MSSSAWSVPSATFPKKMKSGQSDLEPIVSSFPSYTPSEITTYDGESVELTEDLLKRFRGQPEDRITSHNIDLLNRLTQKSLESSETSKGCDVDKTSSKITTLIHQDFIRRYIQTNTPERGLLVYHGLGSGKTATSIGVIEANKSSKKVIVMLPASLQDNYQLEIAKIGPTLFGRGIAHDKPYEWYFHKLDSEKMSNVSRKTGIPQEVLVKNGGIYEIHSDLEEPGKIWDDMDEDERGKISEQITRQLLSQITFVRYNGLNQKSAMALSLDDSIIVIDEIHKISGMVRNRGTLKGGIGKILYSKIKNAKNSKVIGLSGTPLVNSPYEIAVIANMIYGNKRISRVPFKFSSSRRGEDTTKIAVEKDLFSDPIVRYAQVIPSTTKGGGDEIMIQRHQEGFESLFSGESYVGVIRTNRKITKEHNWLVSLSKRISEKGILLDVAKSTSQLISCFPEDEDEFMKTYTREGSEETSDYIKNEESLIRRLMMVSYYRGADPSKYPRTQEIKVVRTEMNKNQFDEYAKNRIDEILVEKKNSSKKTYSDEDDDMFSGRYRTRQLCSVYFPDGRPTKDKIDKSIPKEMIDKEYARRLRKAVNNVIDDPDLSNNISSYSPKYEKVIDIIQKSEGLVLIYSSFLHMEGLEMMGVFLESKGYCPLTITLQKQDDGNVIPRINEMIREDMREKCINASGKRYVVFSGEVEQLIRAYSIRMYRGDFSGLPESLRDDIRDILGDKYTEDSLANLRGELCRILMITSAGAEGLNLKAVRQVHALEPYWNQARLDQVFGRAVRVCSHAELPEEERSVERYVHICGFNTDDYRSAISKGDHQALESKDDGKSTDEYLFNLSKEKTKNNNVFMNLLKSAAIDCPLHAKENGMMLTECYSMPSIAKGDDDRIGSMVNYLEDIDRYKIETSMRDTVILKIGRTVIRTPDGDVDMGRSITAAVDIKTMAAYDPDMIVIRKLHRIGHVEITDDSVATLVLDSKVSVEEPVKDIVVEDAVSAIVRRPVGEKDKYVLAKEDELPEYRPLFEGMTKKEKEEEEERLIEKYYNKHEILTLPDPEDDVQAKVFVLSMGHPGSGKTRYTRDMVDGKYKIRNPSVTYSLPYIKEPSTFVTDPIYKDGKEFIDYEDYVVINVDNIMITMEEYKTRAEIKTDDGSIKVDPRVSGDKNIRYIAGKVRDKILANAFERKLPIIFETTFTNPKYIKDVIESAIRNGYVGQVYDGERESVRVSTGPMAAASGADTIDVPEGFRAETIDLKTKERHEVDLLYPYGGQLIILNFYNKNPSITMKRVKDRFGKEGRYVPIKNEKFSVEKIWEEMTTKRTSKSLERIFNATPKTKYEKTYALSRAVDLYAEVDTTPTENAYVRNEIINPGFAKKELRVMS